jgi:NAD(P)H dehydrogenase (quinone)
MKHAIIVGHPDPDSFTLQMAHAYQEGVEGLGHATLLRDLYSIGFDPRLQVSELPHRQGGEAAADVLAERQLLSDADVFAFVYPLWFNSPPAIVKGYIDRIFGMGFGYASPQNGGVGPLLTGRQLIAVTSSGSSEVWLHEQGALNSVRNLFEDCLGRVTGMRVRPHIHCDGVVPGLKERWVRQHLAHIRESVKKYFAGER